MNRTETIIATASVIGFVLGALTFLYAVYSGAPTP